MTTKLNPKATFSEKKPVLAAILIQLLLLIAVTASGTIATIKELDYTSAVLISFTPMALVIMNYLTARRRWGQIGFKPLGTIPSGGWLYYLPLIAVLIIICSKGLKAMPFSSVLFFIFFTLLVAFVEETVYRGLILNIMLKKGKLAAVLTSSLLFGITHILNALSGQDMTGTMIQIGYSLLVGLVLALLMIRNQNIIPLIMFHFLHNLFQFLGEEIYPIGYDITIMVILLIQCIWLLPVLKRTASAQQS
jgi:uncharacterized protein